MIYALRRNKKTIRIFHLKFFHFELLQSHLIAYTTGVKTMNPVTLYAETETSG